MSGPKGLTADDIETLQRAAAILGVPLHQLTEFRGPQGRPHYPSHHPSPRTELGANVSISEHSAQQLWQGQTEVHSVPAHDAAALPDVEREPDGSTWPDPWAGQHDAQLRDFAGIDESSGHSLEDLTWLNSLVDCEPFDNPATVGPLTLSPPVLVCANAALGLGLQRPQQELWTTPVADRSLSGPFYGTASPLVIGSGDGILKSRQNPGSFYPANYRFNGGQPLNVVSATSGLPGLLSNNSFPEIAFRDPVPLPSGHGPGIVSDLDADPQTYSGQIEDNPAPHLEGNNIEYLHTQEDELCLASSQSEEIALHQTKGGLRRKRKRYNEIHRNQTSLTRRMRGCIRCRMNRKRCVPDPSNSYGECLTCQNMLFNTFRLPCLRYKIVDSALYRNISSDDFEHGHQCTGPRFGDFYLRKVWSNLEVRVFDLNQGHGSVLHLKVRQFEPPGGADAELGDNKGINGAGRKYYCIPWAIADLDDAIKAILDFIDDSVPKYIDDLVGQTDVLVRAVFDEARRLAYFSEPNLLLRSTLRFWTAARFLEGGWRCCGEDKLGAEKISPPWRPKDKIALPPYIDYQFGSIIMEKILKPLSQQVLKSLEDLIMKNQARNWFPIFLVEFILMHSFELIMKHEVSFTARRQYPVRFFDMRLIRAYQSGAKTLLAHFHYINKGNVPFQPNFDWNIPLHRRMAELDDAQLLFMHRFRQMVTNKCQVLQAASQSDHYEAQYWFIGQMFDKSWEPRQTCEHSPP